MAKNLRKTTASVPADARIVYDSKLGWHTIKEAIASLRTVTSQQAKIADPASRAEWTICEFIRSEHFRLGRSPVSCRITDGWYEGLSEALEAAKIDLGSITLETIRAAWRLYRAKYPRKISSPNDASGNPSSPNPKTTAATVDSSRSTRHNVSSVSASNSFQESDVMKVKQAEAVAMLMAMDYNNADQWSAKRLAQKLEGLPKMVDEDTELSDKKLNKLLNDILGALKDGKTLEIIASDDNSDDKPADDKPAKKDSKPAKEAKPAAKKDPGKARGVGVVQTIIDEFLKGTEDKPKTNEQVLAVLVKKFPERPEKAMKSTVSGAKSWMRTEKGLDVRSNEKGIWIHQGGGNKSAKKEDKPAKSDKAEKKDSKPAKKKKK